MPTILLADKPKSAFFVGQFPRSCHLVPPMTISKPDAESTDPDNDELTDKQQADLKDQALQAKYRAAYEQQMRRLSCPGCAEEPFRG